MCAIGLLSELKSWVTSVVIYTSCEHIKKSLQQTWSLSAVNQCIFTSLSQIWTCTVLSLEMEQSINVWNQLQVFWTTNLNRGFQQSVWNIPSQFILWAQQKFHAFPREVYAFCICPHQPVLALNILVILYVLCYQAFLYCLPKSIYRPLIGFLFMLQSDFLFQYHKGKDIVLSVTAAVSFMASH